MNKIKVIFLLIIFTFSTSVMALTIKIGSIAPAKSPWDKALRQMAREWKTISGGSVRIKIYPGGIAGSEKDMIRKMKIGILGGAVFSNRGLTKIYSDFYVLNIPFIFNNNKEFLYVVDKMNPIFERKIGAKGYKVIIWSMAGWVHLFGKKPLIYPKDLKKLKLSFATGEPELEQAWRKSGFQVIPNELKDMLMALQSGMVSAFYLPPLVAASGQYFPLSPYMNPLKIAPVYGGIVLTNKVWNRIPENLKIKFGQTAKRLASDLYRKANELELEAVKTMKANGLKIPKVPENATILWRQSAQKGMDLLINKVFSESIYKKMIGYLNEYRKSEKKQ